jgi:hypothetical protein
MIGSKKNRDNENGHNWKMWLCKEARIEQELDQSLSPGEHFASTSHFREYLAMSKDIFHGHNWERLVLSWVQARNAAKYSTMHRIIP